MEYASWLAGERWSDHPECTHPLLASSARLVNDYTSDEGRSQLVELIPSVIGVSGNDPLVDLAIAIRCSATAIPVVAEHRQRALAVSLLTSQRLLADLVDAAAADDSELSDRARQALAQVPHAARWAEQFTAIKDVKLVEFRRRAAPAAVRISVVGIAEALISDRDGLLYELLTTVIDDCTRRLGSNEPEDAETALVDRSCSADRSRRASAKSNSGTTTGWDTATTTGHSPIVGG